VLTEERRVVPLTLLAQALASLGVALPAWFWFGGVAAGSVALGGLVAVVPNGFLAARLLGSQAGVSPARLLRAAWVGELGKILLTAVAFGVVFASVRPLSAPAVFVGFIAAELGIFAAPLIAVHAQGNAVTTKS
jgi:ATP synthase protein I